MTKTASMKVVFGCPSCEPSTKWPKNAYGELEDDFKCVICGAIGEKSGGGTAELLEKLRRVIETDELEREKSAEREIVLERLSSFEYSPPSEDIVS